MMRNSTNGKDTKQDTEREDNLYKKGDILNHKDSIFDILNQEKNKLIEIGRKDIPQDAINCFEGYSKKFILPEEYQKGNFEKYRYIEHNGYKTYVAMQEKGTGEFIEKEIYLYEKSQKGSKIGHGEIRLGLTENPYFKDKPFVGFTQTEDNFTHQGYGKKRLITMNNICKQVLGLSLHSGTLFSHKDAKKIRENLESQGLAQKYLEKNENNKDRFHFIEKDRKTLQKKLEK